MLVSLFNKLIKLEWKAVARRGVVEPLEIFSWKWKWKFHNAEQGHGCICWILAERRSCFNELAISISRIQSHLHQHSKINTHSYTH